MDKILQSGDGEITITNDGATILQEMEVEHQARSVITLVPTRPRPRGERRSLRSFFSRRVLHIAAHPSLSTPARDAFRLQLTPFNSTPDVAASRGPTLIRSASSSWSCRARRTTRSATAPPASSSSPGRSSSRPRCLLDRGIHPLRIAEGYEMAAKVAVAELSNSVREKFEFSPDEHRASGADVHDDAVVQDRQQVQAGDGGDLRAGGHGRRGPGEEGRQPRPDQGGGKSRREARGHGAGERDHLRRVLSHTGPHTTAFAW